MRLTILALTLALFVNTSACSRIAAQSCADEGVPYQYRVEATGESYYAVLMPASATDMGQEFTMLEDTYRVRDMDDFRTGDPSSRPVKFVSSGADVSSEELGVSRSAVREELDPSRGLRKFSHEGKTYTLVSCAGIFSERFRSDFPRLFAGPDG